MEFNPLTNSQIAIPVALTSGNSNSVSSLQPGQIIAATVITRLADGQTLLDIHGTQLKAQINKPLATGDSLDLKVIQLASLPTAKALNVPIQQLENSRGTPAVRLMLPLNIQSRLQTGEILQGTVTSATSGGKATLTINGAAVTIQTTLPFTQGQGVKLEISDTGKPLLLIPVSADKAGKADNTLAHQMRTLLPQQSGLPELVSNLAALTQFNTGSTALSASINPGVGEILRALARQILQQINSHTDVATAKGIKNALQQSGIFLESALAAAITGQQALPFDDFERLMKSDLKANLLRLLAILQRQLADQAGTRPQTGTTGTGKNPVQTNIPPPPQRHTAPQPQGKTGATITVQTTTQTMLGELLRQVSGTVARIQLHQLASIGREDETGRVITTEVPVRHDNTTDLFHLRIEEQQQQKEKNKTEQPWNISLAFDIGELGPMHVKLTLINKCVNTTFWAEQESTWKLVDSQLDTLHTNYRKTGLTIGHMTCHHGKPPEPLANKLKETHIVDIQA